MKRACLLGAAARGKGGGTDELLLHGVVHGAAALVRAQQVEGRPAIAPRRLNQLLTVRLDRHDDVDEELDAALLFQDAAYEELDERVRDGASVAKDEGRAAESAHGVGLLLLRHRRAPEERRWSDVDELFDNALRALRPAPGGALPARARGAKATARPELELQRRLAERKRITEVVPQQGRRRERAEEREHRALIHARGERGRGA